MNAYIDFKPVTRVPGDTITVGGGVLSTGQRYAIGSG